MPGIPCLFSVLREMENPGHGTRDTEHGFRLLTICF
jgi:hypothetical protein